METTQISKQETFMGKEDLLNHWLGHRNLTRRVIEKISGKKNYLNSRWKVCVLFRIW